MSAVMSTLSMISGGRRTHRKLTSSGRKSGQFSDAGEDRSRSQHDLNKQQRSASLQTLETGGVAGGVVNLESLEAKMASIEVSLVGSRRKSAGARDFSRELDSLRSALNDKDNLIQSLKKQLSASLSAARLAAQAASPTGPRLASEEESAAALSADERRALEERAAAVKSDLETRKANIQDLVRKLEKTHVTENIDTRIQYAELQYKLGREELELQTLSEQARALAQLIEQADAASDKCHRTTLYSTIRECGGVASLVALEAREGSWGAAPRGAGAAVEWVTDHGTIRPGDRLIEVNGTLVVSCKSQEQLQRAIDAANPARIVVTRGQPSVQPQITAGLTKTDAASLRAELGALRSAAEDAEKAKEGLRSDNTRLTHRISYLEDQVAELLARHPQLQSASSNDSCITVNKLKKNVTNINITSEPECRSPKSEVQVFQKGPDITAIVAKLPGLDGTESNLPLMRPRSNASGASSRTAVSPPLRASPPPNMRSHSSHSLEHRVGQMRHSLSHHCIHGAVDYSVETDAAIRMIERNQRHIEKQRLKAERLGRKEEYFRSDSDLDVINDSRSVDRACERHYEIKKAATRIEESIKKTNWAERKTLSIIEQLKRSQRLRKLKKNESAEDIQIDSERQYIYSRIDGKVLENAHKSSRRTSKVHSRSAKSSEFESELSDYPNGDLYNYPRVDYGSESSRMSHYKKNEDRGEVKARPTPPRKPLRLSLHKARSAHSLLNGSESETSRLASEANNDLECSKRPVKRTHAADKWSRERMKDSSRATPRPTRKLLNGLSTCEAPAADDLYPQDSHMPVRVNGLGQNGKWC